ncbi:MAG: hypothetical protein RL300_693 [Pseudomonadota bacterium]|jgi:hypothetical protein
MGIAQWKPGFFVAETARSILPVRLGMAINTLISKVFLMPVVLCVTAVTIRWRLFELQRFVTIFTVSRSVFATQWEAGQLMIKFSAFLPTTL